MAKKMLTILEAQEWAKKYKSPHEKYLEEICRMSWKEWEELEKKLDKELED